MCPFAFLLSYRWKLGWFPIWDFSFHAGLFVDILYALGSGTAGFVGTLNVRLCKNLSNNFPMWLDHFILVRHPVQLLKLPGYLKMAVCCFCFVPTILLRSLIVVLICVSLMTDIDNLFMDLLLVLYSLVSFLAILHLLFLFPL